MEFKTVSEMFEIRTREHPQKIIYHYENDEGLLHSISNKNLSENAKKIAGYLQSQANQGDCILLGFTPGLSFIDAFFGCVLAGMICVPIPPPTHKKQTYRIERILENTHPPLILISDDIKTKHALSEKTVSWSEAIAQNQNYHPPTIKPDDVCILQYTSGSTSEPKGVILTHQNIIANEKMLSDLMEINENSIGVGWVPFYHDQGLIGNIINPLYSNFRAYLLSHITVVHKPIRWLEAISKYSASISGGPNFIYELCVDRIAPKETQNLNLSSWKVAYNGAEPVRPETLKAFSEQMQHIGFKPSSIRSVYGLAETTLIASASPKKTEPNHIILNREKLKNNTIEHTESNGFSIVSSGKSPLDTIICIIDDQQKTVAPNKIGEIVIHGPHVTPGYWKIPDNQQPFLILSDQNNKRFFKTGDLGFMDINGDLYITGRKKDMIIINGENIYPQDIETKIQQECLDVQPESVIAFAVEKEKKEVIIIAAEIKRIALKTSNQTELIKRITSIVLTTFGQYPEHIILVKPFSLPKTSSGKKQRSKTKELYLSKGLDILSESLLPDISIRYNRDDESKIETIINKIIPSQENLEKKFTQILESSLLRTELWIQLEKTYKKTLPLSEFLAITNIDALHKIMTTKTTIPKEPPCFKMMNEIQITHTPIIHHILNARIPQLDAIALSYLPETLRHIPQKNIDDYFYNYPQLTTVYQHPLGQIGLMVLPIFESEVAKFSSETKEAIQTSMSQAINLGVSHISLTGILGSVTGYGTLLPPPSIISLTSGHSMTIAAILIHLRNAIKQRKLPLNSLKIGFLGIGSIGKPTLEAMLNLMGCPKEIHICDLKSQKSRITELVESLQKIYATRFCVSYYESKIPDSFYTSNIIIAATTSGSVLDLYKLKPGSILIDDSYPNCYDKSDYLANSALQKSIHIIEGGVIESIHKINEIRFQFDEKITQKMPLLFQERPITHIPSCILASLYLKKGLIPADQSLATSKTIEENIHALEKNEIHLNQSNNYTHY